VGRKEEEDRHILFERSAWCPSVNERHCKSHNAYHSADWCGRHSVLQPSYLLNLHLIHHYHYAVDGQRDIYAQSLVGCGLTTHTLPPNTTYLPPYQTSPSQRRGAAVPG